MSLLPYNHPWLITGFNETTQVVNEPSDDHFVVSDVGFDAVNTVDNLKLKYLIHSEIKARYQQYRSFMHYSKLMDAYELEQEQKLIKMAAEDKELPPIIYGKRFLTQATLDEFMLHVSEKMEARGMEVIYGEIGPVDDISFSQSGFIAATQTSQAVRDAPNLSQFMKWALGIAFIGALSFGVLLKIIG